MTKFYQPEELKRQVEQEMSELPNRQDLFTKADEECKTLREKWCTAVFGLDEPVMLGSLKGTLTKQGQMIVEAMAKGTVAPLEAAAMLQALAAQARITELEVLEQRLRTLEEWVHEHQTSN